MLSIRLAIVFATMLTACTNDTVPDVGDNGFLPPTDGGKDNEIPHEDGQCFALSREVYPTHYKWCSQQYGTALPVPFACDTVPPEDSCAPVYDGATAYPDRFCCCDPSADAACDFYK